jgi:hypothetical protein
MPTRWTIVYSRNPDFLGRLRERAAHIKTRLQQDIAHDETARLCREWDDLSAFAALLQDLGRTPDELPPALLRLQRPNDNVPTGFAVLNKGKWRAYFRVDIDKKVCWGLFATDIDPGDVAKLGVILTRILDDLRNDTPDTDEEPSP